MSKFTHNFILAICLRIGAGVIFLQSCSTAPQNEQVSNSPEYSEPVVTPVVVKIPDRTFTTDTLYALLVAEMAIDRKRYDIALGNYVQQANSTQDPDVAARATQLARILNSHQAALEMSELWVDLEPDNIDAQSIVTAELIEANRLPEAFDHSTRLLSEGRTTAFESIAANAADGDIAVTRSLLDKYEKLLAEFPDHPELLVGYSMLLEQDNKPKEALRATEKALAVDTDNIRAAFQETRLLQQLGKHDLALQKLAELVEKNPHNGALRARFARILATSNLDESRRQFEILLSQSPLDPDVIFTLGLVEKESGLLDDSAKRFQTLLAQNQHESASHYQLGRIFEEQSKYDEALEHYKQVELGDTYLSAMSQVANILVGKQEPLAALQFLREQREQVEGSYKAGLYMLEANIYSNSGQMAAAETTLTEGLKEFPENTSLLYARAMYYTQADYIAAAEKDLKNILQLTPDNATALNALGYTLADRTNRIDEAYSYIEKALELTPDDPAVLDSMGWVEYRRGNNDRALKLLRQAMEAMPDHEIAAHFGEVLWVNGRQNEAVSVWKKGLENQPESPIIQQTLNRLNASLD